MPASATKPTSAAKKNRAKETVTTIMMAPVRGGLTLVVRYCVWACTSDHEVAERGREMTSQQQRDALHRQIWQIANEVRGAVDGWDFKHFVLGALFYRFIS